MINVRHMLGLISIGAGLVSCTTAQNNNSQEISLKSDRKILDQYRAETPEDVRAENDFLALVLKDMAEVKLQPAKVRERYFKEVRKTRDAFNKQHRKMRDNFNKEQKKNREAFLKELKKERESFVAKKPKSNESSEFFSEQSSKRNVFFQEQADKRKEFQSEMDSSRKEFNDDMSLKQKQFDDAYREYVKNFQEVEKQKKLEKAQKTNERFVAPRNSESALPPASYPGQQQDLEEFDRLKDKPRENLGF